MTAEELKEFTALQEELRAVTSRGQAEHEIICGAKGRYRELAQRAGDIRTRLSRITFSGAPADFYFENQGH